jgi:hypothetical protein
MKIRKQVYELTTDDLEHFPVWEFALDEEGDEVQDEATVRPRESSAPLNPEEGMFLGPLIPTPRNTAPGPSSRPVRSLVPGFTCEADGELLAHNRRDQFDQPDLPWEPYIAVSKELNSTLVDSRVR